MRVVIVEDNGATADSVRHLLDLAGYEEKVAYDGTSCVQAAEERGGTHQPVFNRGGGHAYESRRYGTPRGAGTAAICVTHRPPRTGAKRKPRRD
ncbi:MAG TPA: response regulator [Gemmataceae bacterium]|nr:response regulator [Gemmataceae bacterium]